MKQILTSTDRIYQYYPQPTSHSAADCFSNCHVSHMDYVVCSRVLSLQYLFIHFQELRQTKNIVHRNFTLQIESNHYQHKIETNKYPGQRNEE